VEVPLRSHGEQVSPTMLLHLQDCVLDLDKLGTDKAVVRWQIGQSRNDVQSFIFVSLEDKPLEKIRVYSMSHDIGRYDLLLVIREVQG
jgi:hypothetical protein